MWNKRGNKGVIIGVMSTEDKGVLLGGCQEVLIVSLRVKVESLPLILLSACVCVNHQVDGVDVSGMSRQDVVKLLRDATDSVTLVISRQEVIEELAEQEVCQLDSIGNVGNVISSLPAKYTFSIHYCGGVLLYLPYAQLKALSPCNS